MRTVTLCSVCRRHLRTCDGPCPFCGAARGVEPPRLLHASVMVVTLAVAGMSACVSGSEESGSAASTAGGSADSGPDTITGLDTDPSSDGDSYSYTECEGCSAYGGVSYTYTETEWSFTATDDIGDDDIGDATTTGADTGTTDTGDECGETSGTDGTETGDCDPSDTSGDTTGDTSSDTGTTSG